jgi:hypothetical protein
MKNVLKIDDKELKQINIHSVSDLKDITKLAKALKFTDYKLDKDYG